MAESDPELPVRLKAVEAAVVSLATHRLPENKPTMRGTCHLFNASRCRFTGVASGMHAVDVENHTL